MPQPAERKAAAGGAYLRGALRLGAQPSEGRQQLARDCVAAAQDDEVAASKEATGAADGTGAAARRQPRCECHKGRGHDGKNGRSARGESGGEGINGLGVVRRLGLLCGAIPAVLEGGQVELVVIVGDVDDC